MIWKESWRNLHPLTKLEEIEFPDPKSKPANETEEVK